ncbi:MAG: glycosyltransferase [Crenarchaeota archaeon]|nr:glycosyltransferase [Thermoproteota archaeon]MDW8033480.1 glycosyltransferase [Nitrososphaerota archaeon]
MHQRLQDIVFIFNIVLTPLFFVLITILGNLIGLTLEKLIALCLVSLLFDYSRVLAKVFLLPIVERLKKPLAIKESLHISVIIPAHNEEKTIASCIESVLENKYPWKQIIVVDDGSTDNTYKIASRYRSRITLLTRSKSSMKAYALNYGLRAATGDIVVTVDADTVIAWDFLSFVAKYFSDPFIVAASGNLRVSNYSSNLLTKLQSLEYVIAFDIGRRLQSFFNTLLIIPGAVGVMRKSILESLGGFDPFIGEDFDVTLKMHKVKGKIIFMPETYAWTEVPENWRSWMKQRIRWHRSQIRMLIRHSNLFFRRQFGPPGLIGAPDMFLMDILMLIIRPVWLFYFILTSHNPLLLWLIVIAFYATMELQTSLSAISIVEYPQDIKYWYLFPVMLFFYRPIYALIRLYSYISELIKKSEEW